MRRTFSIGHRLFLAALFSLTLLGGAFALELREGLVKIVVDESIARFSLYRLVDVAKDRYEPLYFDQDVRTSAVTLSFDGRQYKLGDSADFRQTFARIDGGLAITFQSAFAKVTESLLFARSAESSLADGLRVTITVENVSQRDASIGIRWLVDTSLAEKSGIHFRTPGKERLAAETLFEGTSFEDWVSTPGEVANFMVQFVGQGLDRPDRVHFANWKRLNDAPWAIDASSARNFTLLPYSVNDSALAMYWQPRTVIRGGTLSLTTALGSFSEKGYPPATADSGTSALFSKTVLADKTGGDVQSLVAADLLSVRDLLSRIDLALSGTAAASPDEIASWKKILDLLEERKKGY